MFFDDEFERFLKEPFKSFEEIFSKLNDEMPGDGKTLYYGYTMHVGPDGKPYFREFGNIKPNTMKQNNDDSLLVDLIVDKKEGILKLVAEMPGIEKEDIEVFVEDPDEDHGRSGKTICIDAEREDRSYHARKHVVYDIDVNSVDASYINGVLEVKFKLAKTQRAGKKVSVR